MKPFDGLCGIFFHHVGDDDVADVISVDRNIVKSLTMDDIREIFSAD